MALRRRLKINKWGVVSAAEVANTFLELARREGITLTNMQLQKLVYIAFGFYAAIEHKPLFTDEIQAWSYGPVIPNLYHELKRYGPGQVSEFLDHAGVLKEDTIERKIVEQVWSSYHSYTALELSNLTHKANTPWSRVWNEKKKNTTIPFNEILNHYERLFEDSNVQPNS